MQIRPRHHNSSRPDRRRLCAQVRPRTEMETDTGSGGCLSQCSDSSSWEWTQAGGAGEAWGGSQVRVLATCGAGPA